MIDYLGNIWFGLGLVLRLTVAVIIGLILFKALILFASVIGLGLILFLAAAVFLDILFPTRDDKECVN